MSPDLAERLRRLTRRRIRQTVLLRQLARLGGDHDRTRTVMDAALGPLADSVRTERASEA